MYFVPDGTKRCGFYECRECSYRFLSLLTEERIPCPLCSNEVDYEIGPDESLEDILNSALLRETVEGEETVAQMDALLSLAYEDDESWL